MGKFLDASAAFTGRVGVLCGQKWLSLNVIKSAPMYTPSCTTNQRIYRNMFRDAVLYTQFARRVLYPAPMFTTSTMTAYNSRIRQSYEHIKAGDDLIACIPIIKDGFSLIYDTGNIVLDYYASLSILKLEFEKEQSNLSVPLSLVHIKKGATSIKEGVHIYHGFFDSGNNKIANIYNIKTYSIKEGDTVIVCSSRQNKDDLSIIYRCFTVSDNNIISF